MRSSFLRLCGVFLVALLPRAYAQVAWNFTGASGTSAASSTTPAYVQSAVVTVVNGANAIAFNNTNPSSGYTGSSGTLNANVIAKAGALDKDTSTYFQATITPVANVALSVASLQLGTFSVTGKGPIALTLYSSVDNYTAPIGTASLGANSNWALIPFPGLALNAAVGDPITFRLYGSGGALEDAVNWRIDDLSIGLSSTSAPAITDQPQSRVAAVGDLVTFTVGANSTAALTYQWRKNGVDLTGETNSVLTLPAVTLAHAGSYTVAVSNVVATLVSSPATLRFNQAIAFPAIATKAYLDAPFDASVTATSGLQPSLAVVSGPATVTGTTVTLTGPGTVTLQATQAGDSTFVAAAPVTQTFTVTKAAQTIAFPAIGNKVFGAGPIALSATATSGLAPSFVVASGPATVSGSTLTLTGAGDVTVTATQGGSSLYAAATPVSQTFTVDKAAQTIAFPAIANQAYGAAPLTLAATATSGLAPTFAVDSGPATLSGSTLTFTGTGTVTVSAAQAGNGNYHAAPTVTQSFNVVAASATISLSGLAQAHTGQPRAVTATTSPAGLAVTLVYTGTGTTVYGPSSTAPTDAGTYLVTATIAEANYAGTQTGTLTIVAGVTVPIFIQQPATTITTIGSSVTLIAQAVGNGNITYQWMKYSVPIAGATNAALFYDSVTLDHTGIYHVVATNEAGSVTSLPASLYVGKKPQVIAIEASAASAPAGSSITVTASSNSELPVTLAVISGAATLNGSLLIGTGGDVIVRATQAGDTIYEAATLERTFSFTTTGLSPFLTQKPADQTVAAGATVTFRASGIGTPTPTYQWQKDGAAIAGATSTALTLPTVTGADSARYTIVATNSAGTASASALLTVQTAPAIVTQPASETVFAGTPVTLSVVATGTPEPTYQWRKNGTAIAGATRSTYTLGNPAVADAGRYDVVVTNALGSVTSSIATLTINAHDFSGQYFGQFTGTGGAAGEFALLVRSDRTAVLLGLLPGLQTGLAVLNLNLDASGAFSLATSTLDTSTSSATGDTPAAAAAAQAVTVRGTVDDTAGTMSGTLAELGLSFGGTRAARTGSASALAGLYQAALIGSATARGYAIVAADGQAFLLTAAGTLVDGGRGQLDASNHLKLTTTTQTTIDFAFASGALTGTLRTADGATGTVVGAVESSLGREHLVNLSVRTLTTQASPLITGFVISGSRSKQVLIRAAGPALSSLGVSSVLADPTLQVYRGGTAVAQNDDWSTPAANGTAVSAAAVQVGAFAFRAGSADAALVTTLAPAAYSVVIGGGTGTVLAEVYEVLANNETPGARRLVNLSARGVVSPGSPVIAGFVIDGPAPQRVLIRGIGPGLAAYGVTGALGNPQLALYRNTTVIKTNDDWHRDAESALIREATTRAGAFALGASSNDAAMLVYLAPGSYTAQVSGPTNAGTAAGTGVALIEVYESTP